MSGNRLAIKIALFCVIATIVFVGWNEPSRAASYKDDVGFTDLQNELGTSIPDGTGVAVAQVEAEVSATDEDTGETVYTWILNDAHSGFTGKNITFISSSDTTVTSSHATSVGRYFHGNSRSMAPAIADIDAYEVNDWLGSGFLAYGVSTALLNNPVQPYYQWSSELSSPSRIANHSWVGSSDLSAELLRRIDFVIESDEYIQIVALANSGTQQPLLSGSFNAVTVGTTDGDHPSNTSSVDDLYVSGRACPLVVAPLAYTSYANPVVASAAALLVQTGQSAGLSTDPEEQSTQNRDGDTIANAERSEVVKAALICGADRVTHNTSSSDQIADYIQDTANGLDRRFGAGQVNVYHSYRIIAAGEQNSAEDDSEGEGQIGTHGFDFDPAFGGSGTSNTTASYTFTADQDRAMLYAALVWNLDIDGGAYNNWDDTATLYDFDLTLQDITDENNPIEVAASTSTVDNTENLWVPLSAGHAYRLQVILGAGQTAACSWDYALAWRITVPPDSDGDALPDDWEVYNGLDYQVADSDGDGLDDGDEVDSGTDPLDEDSDDDGYSDGAETAAGTDPLDAADYPQQVASVPAVTPIGMVATLVALLGIAGRRFNSGGDDKKNG